MPVVFRYFFQSRSRVSAYFVALFRSSLLPGADVRLGCTAADVHPAHGLNDRGLAVANSEFPFCYSGSCFHAGYHDFPE